MKKQNNQNISSLGIDISKEYLDIFHLPSKLQKRYKNTNSDILSLIVWIKQNDVDRIVFEPSGGYEKSLKEILTQEKVSFSMVNASNIRYYARARGLLAKTDNIDAFVLADYGNAVNPRVSINKTMVQEKLTAWIRRRDQIIEHVRIEHQRFDRKLDTDIEKGILQTIDFLKKQKEIVEKKIDEIMKQDKILFQQSSVLMREKGVGLIAAATLLSELPEIGKIENKQIASLVGVAPRNNDSGKRKGFRSVYGGRKFVRKVLYMAVISAIRSNEKIKKFYKRLRNNGKKAKVAIVACIRKLLIILNASLKTQFYGLSN